MILKPNKNQSCYNAERSMIPHAMPATALLSYGSPLTAVTGLMVSPPPPLALVVLLLLPVAYSPSIPSPWSGPVIPARPIRSRLPASPGSASSRLDPPSPVEPPLRDDHHHHAPATQATTTAAGTATAIASVVPLRPLGAPPPPLFPEGTTGSPSESVFCCSLKEHPGDWVMVRVAVAGSCST